MKRVLVLGHNGMLGNAVYTFLSKQKDTHVLTVANRWGDELFANNIIALAPDFIINCIGAIPQKKPKESDYISVNHDLPLFLETLGVKIIHATTDSEFDGSLPVSEFYTKESIRTATDTYGVSKSLISKKIEEDFINTKVMRTSIIGHEKDTSVALLDWFLHSEGAVHGYTNHYWNGITTLQWAKEVLYLLENWENSPVLTQLGTSEVRSKYELLFLFKEIYRKENEIVPFATERTVNKALESDRLLPNLRTQLEELREFYKK